MQDSAVQNNGQLDYAFQANRTDALPEQVEGGGQIGFMVRKVVVTSKGEANDKVGGGRD